jgi:hypothetical protein
MTLGILIGATYINIFYLIGFARLIIIIIILQLAFAADVNNSHQFTQAGGLWSPYYRGQSFSLAPGKREANMLRPLETGTVIYYPILTALTCERLD